MSDVEGLLISKVLGDGDLVTVLDSGINEQFFAEGSKWRQAWQWIYRYWSEHGEQPKVGPFKRSFPTFSVIDVDEPLSALIEELKERHKKRLFQIGVQEAVDLFDSDKGVDTALTALQRTLSKIDSQISSSTVEVSDEFIGGFIVRVLSQESSSLLGIPTGFPTIDLATGGLQAEQFITIVGLPKRGKSSVALAAAMSAQFKGHDVMFISFEMSNEEQKQRYLSIGAGVSLTGIQRGMLTEQEKQAVVEFEAEVIDCPGRLLLVHDMNSATTVGGIAAQIEKHRPAVVFIDGTYMMLDEQGEPQGSPQALTNITRSLKRLAQKAHIPIVNTTQALFQKTSRKRGIEMQSIGYSSSWSQDSDVLIGMDRDDLNSPYAELKIVAARNALGVSTRILIDYQHGRIVEIGSAETGASFNTDMFDDEV